MSTDSDGERVITIQIVDFSYEHIERAAFISRMNYEAERHAVPALPHVMEFPELKYFADNGLGVAALESSELVGFLCVISPFPNVFRSTDATGVFSPIHANGTIIKNRGVIYARMYQAAGEKWMKAGASSHAVCLYAHDKVGQEQFFRYGFGMRCIDAIRGIEEIETLPKDGLECAELSRDEYPEVLPLIHMLDKHMASSPTFILRRSVSEKEFIDTSELDQARYFVARADEKIVAYLKAERDGETFICEMPGYIHITGAFCLPEYRGMGVCRTLLAYMLRTLKADGFTRLGVDFESINPTAYGFWLKYFDAYTHSVVRRIDEHVMLR